MKNYYTIQIFSSNGKIAITKRISKTLWILLLTLLIIIILGIVMLTAFYSRAYLTALKAKKLQDRNKYLEEQFDKIKQLEKDINEISRQREKLEIALGITKKTRKSSSNQTTINYNNQTSADNNGENISLKNKEMKQYLSFSKQQNRTIPNIMPVNGWITKRFSLVHRGIDIAAPEGTPILSSTDGIVSFVGWDSILGNVIKVKSSSGYTTLYGHCLNVFVKKGDFVRKSAIIASVGKTGRTEAPHLHYEILMNKVNLNPELFFTKTEHY